MSRTTNTVTERPLSVVTPGRAAQILGTRHDAILAAIRSGDLAADRIEAHDSTVTYVVRRTALRKYRQRLVARYKKSPVRSRQLMAEHLETVTI